MRWTIAILVSLIAAAALGQERPLLASAPAASPTEGFRSADVEGLTFRYFCQGAGSPTVIIEQGGGISIETVFSWKQRVGWAALAPKIASLTRLCVYDRVGLGRSSTAERARTSFDIATELHALLTREDIRPPYVLAGQSLGGMNALAFSKLHRDEVVGLVLIDSSHPQQLQRMNAVLPPRRADEAEVLRGFRDGPDDKSPLPREWQAAIEPLHQQLQRELAGASTDSKHTVAQKAGHNTFSSMSHRSYSTLSLTL